MSWWKNNPNNYESFALELQDLDMVAVGAKYTNGSWVWNRDPPVDVNSTAVGWPLGPPSDKGDCMGVSKNATSTSIFPCIHPKRVMCSYA